MEGGKFKTHIGGLLTIFLILGLLALIWYFGRDIYERKLPFFIEKTDFRDDAPVMFDHKYNETFVAFSLEAGGENYFDDIRYIEHFAYHDIKIWNATSKGYDKSKPEASVERCSTKHIDNATLQTMDLRYYHCFTPSSPHFGGENIDGSYDYPVLIVRFCNKDTENKYNITCATKEEKIKKFTGEKSYINLIYQNNLVNPGEYENYFKRNYFYHSTNIDILDNTTAYYNRVHFRLSSIGTDKGIIFSEWVNNSFMEYNDMVVSMETPSDDFFVKVYLRTSRVEKLYQRFYIKIPDAIAKVGGFMSLFFEILGAVYSFYLNNAYHIFLYNKLYNLQIDDESLDQNIINNNIQSISPNIQSKKIDFELKNLQYIDDVKNSNLNSSTNKLNYNRIVIKQHEYSKAVENKEIKKLIMLKKRKKTHIEIDSCERFRFNYCCYEDKVSGKRTEKKLRYELLLTADKDIKNRSEIFEIFKLLDQFKLLLKLFLNESQGYMIKNRGKQEITNDFNWTSNNEEIQKIEEIRMQKQINKLSDYLLEKKRSNSISNIDMLLFYYLDTEAKEKMINKIQIEDLENK